MLDSKDIRSINYQVEELQRQKETLKKELAKAKINETAKMMFEENTKDPLNLRETENILYSLYLDLKNIIED